MSIVLLASALLFVRSLQKLLAIDPGGTFSQRAHPGNTPADAREAA
jgi:hypothetical protein